MYIYKYVNIYIYVCVCVCVCARARVFVCERVYVPRTSRTFQALPCDITKNFKKKISEKKIPKDTNIHKNTTLLRLCVCVWERDTEKYIYISRPIKKVSSLYIYIHIYTYIYMHIYIMIFVSEIIYVYVYMMYMYNRPIKKYLFLYTNIYVNM